MKTTLIIMKKELKSFLLSPLAYVIGVVILVFFGIFFTGISIESGYPELGPTFQNFTFILIFAIPLITMRLVAEEKKRGTIELLMTLPARAQNVIMGKFLAVTIVYVMILGVTLIHTLVLALLGSPAFWPIFTGYLGVILMGMALLSLGLFISTLTESQVVAGLSSLGLGLFLLLIRILSRSASGKAADVIKELSFFDHLNPFLTGLIDLKHVAFFAIFIALGLVLSINYMENEKWRK